MRRILPGRRPQFPDPSTATLGLDGFCFIGGSLSPETLIEAYENGYFPWDWRKPYPWFSPDPRTVILPGGFKVSDSLRKQARSTRWSVRYDTAFVSVIDACATVPREGQGGTWITERLYRVYGALHRAGFAHSVETFDESGELIGGLWGLSLGRVFFGESMFAKRSNASKLALWDLCHRLTVAGYAFVDCQAHTPHLERLGAVGMPREVYLRQLAEATSVPSPWEEAMEVPSVVGRAR